MLRTWKIINNKIDVTSEAQVPGANFIFPIPNKVTNKKLILFIIIYNWSNNFSSYSFFFTY